MARPRARAVGLAQFLLDGRTDPYVERMTKAARKAEEGLPERRSRACGLPDCETLLSRYAPGPLCLHHERKMLGGKTKGERRKVLAEYGLEPPA